MAVFSGNGSNTAPSFTFSSNTNTGFFRNGSNNIGVAANATHVAGFQDSGAHFYVTGTGTAASPNFGIGSNGRPDVAISGAANAIATSNGDLARFGSSATDTAISLASIAASGTTNGSAGIRFFPAQNGSVWSEIRGGRDGVFNATSNRDTNLIFLTGENESAPTEKMRLTSNGYLRMASGTGGIQFNGDAAAANALDDYEQGTSITTIPSITATTNQVQMFYTKVGSLVNIVGVIELAGISADDGTNAVFTIPFTPTAYSTSIPGGNIQKNTINASVKYLGYYGANSIVYFNNVSGGYAGAGTLGNGEIGFTMTYTTF